jgi:hypothetical protein
VPCHDRLGHHHLISMKAWKISQSDYDDLFSKRYEAHIAQVAIGHKAECRGISPAAAPFRDPAQQPGQDREKLFGTNCARRDRCAW